MEGHEFKHDSMASIHLHRKVWSHNVESQLKLAVSYSHSMFNTDFGMICELIPMIQVPCAYYLIRLKST